MQAEDVQLELLFKNLGLRHFGRMEMEPNLCVAYSLVFLSIFIFILFIYAAFASKLMPDTNIYILPLRRRAAQRSAIAGEGQAAQRAQSQHPAMVQVRPR